MSKRNFVFALVAISVMLSFPSEAQLRRQNTEGRQAGRHSGRAADEI